ncbi:MULTISPECIES: alpha-lytic protease prodomain-containing protein [unclassified Crossiella]|uniref:alpha-lytic protease prodomain-containing protein n=1 Tax=unclassified Crossiella TaxID=2620835 RepID=UPI001FFFE147|nr:MULTISPECIES: alpha-lytic protease prodomain-containing protein [unclassified Crossiella]MCK2241662.1 S1 family peptidase [Crossiella sp. S99.2]MCK2255466.1 S1 family peptidase [Crossiella sp. S99.1]
MRRPSLSTFAVLTTVTLCAAAFATPATATPATLTEAAGPTALETARTALSTALGGSFAGSWLDLNTGKLVVGVTDPAGSARVRAAGAIPKTVQHSESRLRQLQSTLDNRATSAPDSVAGWHVDLPANQLVVSLVGNDPAGAAWIHGSGLPGIRVDRVAAAPQLLWDIIGGQGLYFSGHRCSVGFSAFHDDDHYVLTAGHCARHGGTVRGAGGTIGTVSRSSFPGNDYGTVRVSKDDANITSKVDRYGEGSDVRIEGSSAVGINGRVCRSGSTTGWHCGRVLAIDETANYGDGNVVRGLTRTDACAERGDSGGSFVSRPEHGRAEAQGMLSGGSGNCKDGGGTYFQPVREVLRRYDLTLKTT